MKVLIALDLSVSSDKVIEAAKCILLNNNPTESWLIHVADPEPDFAGNKIAVHSDRMALANQFHEEHKSLQNTAKELRQENIDCIALLVQGSFADTILDKANELDVDIIVVGSHGKGMAKQLLVGSTSEAILESSKIPVLVVPVT